MNNYKLNYLPVAAACFKSVRHSLTGKPDYTFIECNEQFKNLFGIDVSGKKFSQISLLSDFLTKLSLNIEKMSSKFVFKINENKFLDVFIKPKKDIFTVCIVNLNLQEYFRENGLSYINQTLKSFSAGIITANLDGFINYLNPAAKEITGWDNKAIGLPLYNVLEIRHDKASVQIDIVKNTENGESTLYNNVLLRKKDGTYIDITLNVTMIQLPDGNNGYIIFFRDSSNDRRREREVAYLSYHDKLTGLYNRAYFERKLKELDKPEYYPVAIIIGDTNGLKMTNDVFGHGKGDMLLINIANILSLACRENDIIARYGGDEFTVLMPNTTLEESASICKKILTLCNDQSIQQSKISISLGYAAKTNAAQNINDVLKIAEDFMYRHKLLESKSYRSSVISSLKNMLFEKSFETEEHAMRLTGLCNKAGRLMGLSQSDLNDLELFSMLHDIGKIGINDCVLLKPGKLNDVEWIEMRRHCEIGYRIAQSAPELAHIADYILCHHERWDGKGYPQGLKGTQIPLLSRILAVADSYDAMVNDRYYRKALSHEAAIEELKRCSGTQFDPDIVKVFLQILTPSAAIDTSDYAQRKTI